LFRSQTVQLAIAFDRQSRCRNMNAKTDHVFAQERDGNRVVDFCSEAVVHRIGDHIGYRKVVEGGVYRHSREGAALGKVGSHKSSLMQRKRMWPRAYRQQQTFGRRLLLLYGRGKGLPLV